MFDTELFEGIEKATASPRVFLGVGYYLVSLISVESKPTYRGPVHLFITGRVVKARGVTPVDAVFQHILSAEDAGFVTALSNFMLAALSQLRHEPSEALGVALVRGALASSGEALDGALISIEVLPGSGLHFGPPELFDLPEAIV